MRATEGNAPDPLPAYALRFTQTAIDEIDAAHAWMASTAGQSIADEWRDGLMEAIGTLATLPEREPIAPRTI